eukprot:scaffold14212_cov66-Phaeocystis_antarctica.AAC.1
MKQHIIRCGVVGLPGGIDGARRASEGISSPARFGSHRRCQREAVRPCEGPIELQGPRPSVGGSFACAPAWNLCNVRSAMPR